MNIKELIDILHVANNLKIYTRHNFTTSERAESVAEHTYRMSLFAFLAGDLEEFSDVDIDKVIKMCLIHDLGEAFTKDIPSFYKTEKDSENEEQIFDKWVASFSEPTKSKWQDLLTEMNALETKEAKLYKALDKLEAVLAHNEADVDTWLELEHSLQLTYAKDASSFSDTLTKMNEYFNEWTKEKSASQHSDKIDPKDPI